MPRKGNMKRKYDKELEYLRTKLSKLEKKMNKIRRYESESIAVRWSSYLSTGLDRETKVKLLEKYKIPQNCKIVGGPKLNQELEAMLTPLELKKNNFLLELQALVGKGLVAIEKVLSNLIEKKRGETQEGEIEPDADLVGLAEAGQIICSAHNTISKHRQFQLSSHFNDKIKKIVASQTIDLFLFGQDFGDKWKKAKALQTTARELQAAEPSTSKNALGQASKKRWKTSMHKGKLNQAKRFSYPRNNQYKRDRESYRKGKSKRYY
nr:unnamed protein product [Callosobruchus analis]